jgi:hypothetical protein
LAGCKALTDLDVGGNCELGDAGAIPILEAVKGHPRLAKLNLSTTGLTSKSAPAVQVSGRILC